MKASWCAQLQSIVIRTFYPAHLRSMSKPEKPPVDFGSGQNRGSGPGE